MQSIPQNAVHLHAISLAQLGGALRVPAFPGGPDNRDLLLYHHRTEHRRKDRMMALAKKFWNDESGQGLAEYALLLGLIVVGVVLIIQGMGKHIQNIFGKANNELATADM